MAIEQDSETPGGPAAFDPLLVRMCLVIVLHPSVAFPTSTHAEASASATANPAETAAQPAAPSAAQSPPVPPDAAMIAKFMIELDAIETALDLDIVVRPNDKYQIRALKRVPDKALGLAAGIVSEAPERFLDFASLPATADYVALLAPLAARVAMLATHIEKAIQNQRTPAANMTLALYAVVKNLGRLVGNETMREKVAELKGEVAPKRKNPKPKVTNEQRTAKRAAASHARRVTKAIKLLSDAGLSVASSPPALPPLPATATPATESGSPNGTSRSRAP